MNVPHKHAPMIKAWADGKQIQVYVASVGKWMDVTEPPLWNPDLLYRVKPEDDHHPGSITLYIYVSSNNKIDVRRAPVNMESHLGHRLLEKRTLQLPKAPVEPAKLLPIPYDF